MLPLIDVALAFGWLGLTAFGGPVAHLAFFRRAFVERRGWLDEAAFAEIVALCQVLPGPTSSEVAFALGKHRAGWAGAVIAWAAFALPSAVLMTAFALLTPLAAMGKVGAGVIHGLKLAAVAIVAQALWGMATTLAPDRARASIAVVALGVVMLAPGGIGQIAAIGLGAVAGWVFCRGLAVPVKARAGAPVGAQGNTGPRRLPLAALIPVGLFVALFAVGGSAPGGARLFAAFYRSGALVFGGGHVVLPLLHDAVTGAGGISDGAFLAGYGAAQALPGPLFSIAAYLGALSPTGPQGVIGAQIALIALSLPGLLLTAAGLGVWHRLTRMAPAQAALAGVNAAVVGLLAAAFYNPVWTAVGSGGDLGLVAAGVVLLMVWHAPPILVVGLCVIGGAALGVSG